MEPLTFVIALMGCADSGAVCRQQRVEAHHYASAAQCEAAIPAALYRNTDIDYPVVEARCRQTSQRWADADGNRDNRG